MFEKRILAVDDDPDLQKMLDSIFRRAGYLHIRTASSGPEALRMLKEEPSDFIILDIMMPGMDGFAVLREIRRTSRIPVLMLTARGEAEDRIAGLESGADDYLVKPFAFDELLARLRVMIRRTSDSTSDVFTVADLTVDCTARTVKRGGKAVSLSSKEFAILEYMIRNSGVVLSREKISHHIWNYDYEGGSNVVDVYIRYLRKKIDEGHTPKLIHTVRGAGYVLKE